LGGAQVLSGLERVVERAEHTGACGHVAADQIRALLVPRACQGTINPLEIRPRLAKIAPYAVERLGNVDTAEVPPLHQFRFAPLEHRDRVDQLRAPFRQPFRVHTVLAFVNSRSSRSSSSISVVSASKRAFWCRSRPSPAIVGRRIVPSSAFGYALASSAA